MSTPLGPTPSASSPTIRRVMQKVRTRDTAAEMKLRRELYKLGLRYRVDVRPLKNVRRTADVVFRSARVAVFVDGCFWHSCPVHGNTPKTNRNWWAKKLARTRYRDADTDARLEAAGWIVVRIWEHEASATIAPRIYELVKSRLPIQESPPKRTSRESPHIVRTSGTPHGRS